MLLEIIFGLISNSLGLLTDGAHMFLDCSAIIIGVYSSYVSERPADRNFNFGYYRADVIGTFINSVFLLFIALYIILESLERFLHPKNIVSDHILLISLIGLIVNVIGVIFLHEMHGKASHSHSNNCCQSKKSHQYIDVEKGEEEESTSIIY